MTYDDVEDNLIRHADAIVDLDNRLKAVEAKLAGQNPTGEPPLSHRVEVAIRRIYEFDFDSHWDAGDVRLLANDAEIVASELSNMAAGGGQRPAEPKPASEPKYLVLDSNTMNRLPCDFAEAIEQCKLAIVRHRADGWFEIPQVMAVGAFESLARMASREPTESKIRGG